MTAVIVDLLVSKLHPAASAAGEKLAAVMTMDDLRREAASGRRADFEKYLGAVARVAVGDSDEVG